MTAQNWDIKLFEPSLQPWKPEKDTSKQIAVLMSGGVDSSVAALILKSQGYEVAGAYMKNWSDSSFFKDKKMCPWEDDVKDAKKVAVQLGIPFYTFNF